MDVGHIKDGDSKHSRYDLLRDKIKSKMDVAKLLGTFLTAVLGGILAFKIEAISFLHDDVLDYRDGFFYSGLLAMSAAIILFFATVVAYDRLLMPFDYWAHDKDKTDAELQRLMVQASHHYFFPAGIFSGVGFPLLVFAVLDPNPCVAVAIAAPCGVLALWLVNDTRKPDFVDA